MTPIFPAAFGRLCVETTAQKVMWNLPTQPPSGGCVLKPIGGIYNAVFFRQPPSGGCVLKLVVVVSSRGVAWPSRLRAAVC